MIDRDPALERQLTELAARSAGLVLPNGKGNTLGLDDFAHGRALPGGIRADIDPTREAREEIADTRNYLTFGVTLIYDRVLAGDPAVLDDYERWMRTLRSEVVSWHQLNTISS